MMSIVLVGLVVVETIGLAILWSRYNSIKADITEELIAEPDEQIEEDYDYFRYNYKAVLEADIEEIYERMVQALGKADFDTYDELEKDYNSLIEQLKSELVIEELLASR